MFAACEMRKSAPVRQEVLITPKLIVPVAITDKYPADHDSREIDIAAPRCTISIKYAETKPFGG